MTRIMICFMSRHWILGSLVFVFACGNNTPIIPFSVQERNQPALIPPASNRFLQSPTAPQSSFLETHGLRFQPGEKKPVISEKKGVGYITFKNNQLQFSTGPHASEPLYSGKAAVFKSDSDSKNKFFVGSAEQMALDPKDRVYLFVYQNDSEKQFTQEPSIPPWSEFEKYSQWKVYILNSSFQEFVQKDPFDLQLENGNLEILQTGASAPWVSIALQPKQPLVAKTSEQEELRIYRTRWRNRLILLGFSEEVTLFAVPDDDGQ